MIILAQVGLAGIGYTCAFSASAVHRRPNTSLSTSTSDWAMVSFVTWLPGMNFGLVGLVLVFIISVRCLNSTKYKYQEGWTKRENRTEQRGKCNWKERKTERNGEGMWTGRIHEPLLEQGNAWTEGASPSLFMFKKFQALFYWWNTFSKRRGYRDIVNLSSFRACKSSVENDLMSSLPLKWAGRANYGPCSIRLLVISGTWSSTDPSTITLLRLSIPSSGVVGSCLAANSSLSALNLHLSLRDSSSLTHIFI